MWMILKLKMWENEIKCNSKHKKKLGIINLESIRIILKSSFLLMLLSNGILGGPPWSILFFFLNIPVIFWC